MNREILFRGRRLDNGEWAEGFYFCRDTQHYIKVPVVRNGVVVLTDYEVNPDTIGQFTGLLDKNGRRVFEGDVLSREAHWSIAIEYRNGGFVTVDADIGGVRYNNDCGIEGLQMFYGKGMLGYWEVSSTIHDQSEKEE